MKTKFELNLSHFSEPMTIANSVLTFSTKFFKFRQENMQAQLDIFGAYLHWKKFGNLI